MSQLEVATILQSLTEPAASRLEKFDVFSSIPSTNTFLMTQPPPAVGQYRVAIADEQSAGRGRRSRRWISEPGAGLYLSVSYTFGPATRDPGGLTLATGVGVAEALERLDVSGIRLKWPNDIIALDGKLGGILTELRSGTSDGVTVVTGVGLNLEIPQDFDLGTESSWAPRAVDLQALMEDPPGREHIAGALLESLYAAFVRFEQAGLESFLGEWSRRDWLQGKSVTVDLPDRQVTGTAAGVGDDGSLLVKTANGPVSVISGTIVTAGLAEQGR